MEYCRKLYMRHTFWSCLIRCVKMKCVQLLLRKIQSGYDSVHRRTDGHTPVVTLVHTFLGVLFLCGYRVLCGCVRLPGPTKRCPVDTLACLVHRFGCRFFLWGYRLCVVAHQTKQPQKDQLYQKLATEVVFCKNEQSIHGHLDTSVHTCVRFVTVHTWTLGHKCP